MRSPKWLRWPKRFPESVGSFRIASVVRVQPGHPLTDLGTGYIAGFPSKEAAVVTFATATEAPGAWIFGAPDKQRLIRLEYLELVDLKAEAKRKAAGGSEEIPEAFRNWEEKP